MPEPAALPLQNAPSPRPKSLGEQGGDLWDSVQSQWVLTPAEERLLLDACRLTDEIDQLERGIAETGVTVPGSKGQVRANPLIGEARSHRLAVKQLLAALKLRESLDAENNNKAHHGRSLAAHRWERD